VGLAVSTPTRATLAVWGNPIVGRALVLLLRGYGYDARFLPISSLPESLGGVELLVIAPTRELSTERREAHLALLRGAPGGAKEVPILELVTLSEEPLKGGAQDKTWHTIPWPCKIEKLERRISALLSHASRSTA
jgi:hypothetical protein